MEIKETFKYRDNGAVGALLDEYERSVKELKGVISQISTNQMVEIIDKQTKDPDCKSIQTVLSHVVGAGYNYVIAIRKWLGEEIDYREKEILSNVQAYSQALDQMFRFNVKLFDDYPDIILEELNSDRKITVRWGQEYDVEQLYEHAIVHVLRHRRQIERFLLNFNNDETRFE